MERRISDAVTSRRSIPRSAIISIGGAGEFSPWFHFGFSRFLRSVRNRPQNGVKKHMGTRPRGQQLVTPRTFDCRGRSRPPKTARQVAQQKGASDPCSITSCRKFPFYASALILSSFPRFASVRKSSAAIRLLFLPFHPSRPLRTLCKILRLPLSCSSIDQLTSTSVWPLRSLR